MQVLFYCRRLRQSICQFLVARLRDSIFNFYLFLIRDQHRCIHHTGALVSSCHGTLDKY